VDGGILVAPIETNGQQVITRFIKERGKITEEKLEDCDFVPILNGVQK